MKIMGRTAAFGVGRENIAKHKVGNYPGPGTYEPLKPLGEEARKFKMKFKLNYGDPMYMAKLRNVPGPGAHEDVTKMNETG